VIHNIICVFEAKPFIGREDGEIAEGGRAADNGFVAAEKGHGVYIVGGKVESWSSGVEACDCWLGVDVEEGL
jgi:hypothetical protein